MKPNTAEGILPGTQDHTRSPLLSQDPKGIPIGTIVLTMDGELPVDHLVSGDQVITRDRGVVTLRDIRVQTMRLAPIRFCVNSLGHRRPGADILLPPNQTLLIRDWRAQALFAKSAVMVEAARLVDGQFVRAEAETTLTLYWPIFDASHVIYAGGLELVIELP